MAVTMISNLGPNSPDDIVVRQRAEHMAKVDAKAVFENEVVKSTFGPAKTPVEVMLRYESGSTFAFACYNENDDWHDRSREEWAAGAGDALEKFCAMRDVQIIAGPRPEITNRYNLFVEVRGRLE